MGEQEAPVSGFPVQTQKLLLKSPCYRDGTLELKSMEDLYLMAKYNYMIEYLQGLYSTFAFFKTTEMSPLMKHSNTMNQKDEC